MPACAVVDENVNLAKYALRPGAGNMVNSILRKLFFLKDTNSLPLPELVGDDRTQAHALATIYSHPVANTAKGFTRNDLIKKLDILKVSYEPSMHLDNFIRIRSGMQIVLQTGFLREGLCSVQDESAGCIN